VSNAEGTTEKIGWRFSRAFWIANGVEVLERAAWYGVFVAITLYLSRILGYTDVEAAATSGVFVSGLYFLPTFSGAYADRIGFRASLLLAFGLLTIGYGSMWVLPTMLESAGLVEYGVAAPDSDIADQVGEIVVFKGLDTSWHKWLFIPVMIVIMVGGSFIKSVITGTVALETTEKTRARGYSVFYAMVNVGAFSGKTIVKPLRESLGNDGLIVLNLFAASMTLLAFVLVLFFYRSARAATGEGKSFAEIWRALIAVCKRARLVFLILIITGFWIVQHQLYASMPKYVLRMAGEASAVSWYANVNPGVVVVFVALVTHWMRNHSALFAMTVGMFIMPLSAFCMAAGALMSGEILGFHPVAAMMLIGIGFQGLAECFISPRYLEYFSLQAPKGEEGLYLGFSHLHSFVSALIGFGISGIMLQSWCPDPRTLAPEVQAQRLAALAGEGSMPAAYQHAHYLWYVFVAIATVSGIALIVYGKVTAAIDAKKTAGE
jgi:dipeptide/tripeptide permease